MIAQIHQQIGQLTLDLDWLKKVQVVGNLAERRTLIDANQKPSVRRQCELLNISRGAYYYEPCPESQEHLELMRRLDPRRLDSPAFGSPRLTTLQCREGRVVNRKRISRLLQIMGIEAIYPRSARQEPGEDHEIFPYLLRDVEIAGRNQVWCSDITCIPMREGCISLVAVMDWWSRYVLSSSLSNTMEADFCVRASEMALKGSGRAPLISNTGQRSHLTSAGFIDVVQSAGTDVSLDGRGRWIDNRFIERL